MAEKNIVIVGAGFGGVFAAKTLSKKLKSHKEYNIILIDKHSYFTYMTELHEVASKRVAPKHVQDSWIKKTWNISSTKIKMSSC